MNKILKNALVVQDLLSMSHTLLIHELILLPSSSYVRKVFEDGDRTRPFRVGRDGDIIRDRGVPRDGDVTRDGDVIDRSDMGPYDTEVKSYSFNF